MEHGGFKQPEAFDMGSYKRKQKGKYQRDPYKNMGKGIGQASGGFEDAMKAISKLGMKEAKNVKVVDDDDEMETDDIKESQEGYA